MPVINNATVASGTGLSTAGNGGRKLVRLADGSLWSVTRTTSSVSLYKSVNDGTSWSFVETYSSSSLQDASLATDRERVYLLVNANSSNVRYLAYNASGVRLFLADVDPLQSALGNVSLAINEAGTELHAAWSSKNSTYPNSFNIRYAKGTINPDGSVTWGAVEQVTKINFSNVVMSGGVAIALDKTATPTIFWADTNLSFSGTNGTEGSYANTTGYRTLHVVKRDKTLLSQSALIDNAWSVKDISSNNTSSAQSSPSALFVPAAINGLANGRLWVAWHGKDATDSAKFNVRVSYSDDGGVTWSTPVKLTSGNTFDCQNVSLSADKTGKVFALYESHQWAPDIGIRMKTYNGSWGTEVGVATASTAEQYPSSLVDYSLMMTTPPTVYTDTTEGIKFSGNFNVGASVSPASGALGNKETAALTAYTVTPEAGSTVTQIVEKVNGVTVNTFNNPASLSRTLTVPTATWDTLAYFATHTASITVTDSNGATTVTTYNFDKRLATGASLLEATKANTDAKNRISTKRDALAAQVGLSAGATFDAISAQLASGAFKKFQSGSGRTTTHNTNYTKDTVNGVAFTPSLVVIIKVGVYTGTAILQTVETSKPGWYSDGNTSSFDSYRFITGGSFGFFITGANATDYIWLAYGN
ncbi:sialidase family protein [Exiguobacterium sp. s22]|uniref:sialidase family protein n=1 Tax=Exiguobacterium sp. s22 TaxID=2751272 RepID=UPI001BE83A7E|nr:sialidase family protein [Exiguobacterium sp. s22]